MTTGIPASWLPSFAMMVSAAVVVVLALAAALRPLRERGGDLAVLAFALVAAAAVAAMDSPSGWLVNRVLVADPFATFFHFVLALVATGVAWLSTHPAVEVRGRAAPAAAVAAGATRAGVAAGLALSLLGLQAMVAATAAWTLWAGFEVAGLGIALAMACHGGQCRRETAASILRGALASSLLLAGFALLAGLTGATDYASLADRLVLASSMPGGRAALTTGVVAVVAALSVRMATVPWLAWPAADIAPLPLRAWTLVAGSLAASAAIARLLGSVASTPGPGGSWQAVAAAPWASILSVASMATTLVASVGMLRESSLPRVFAWIAAAQSGYLLTGLAAASAGGLEAALFQGVVNAVTLVGLAAALRAVPGAEGCEGLDAIRGLARRGDALAAAALVVLLLSFAGLPPLAGYAGRARLLAAAAESGRWILVTVTAVSSAIGWMGVLRLVAMLFEGRAAAPESGAPSAAGNREAAALRSRTDALTLTALLVAATVAIGVAPSGLAAFAARSVVFFGG